MEVKLYSRGVHNLYYRGLRAVVQLGQDCSTLVDVEHHWSVHQLHLKENGNTCLSSSRSIFIKKMMYLIYLLFSATSIESGKGPWSKHRIHSQTHLGPKGKKGSFKDLKENCLTIVKSTRSNQQGIVEAV